MPEPSFKQIGRHPDNPEGHVFFIHGFKGHDLKTWIAEPALEGWPQWLSKEFPRLAIWSIRYQTSASSHRGGDMSLRERAIQLIEEMDGIGLVNGQYKLFICHSLGGLVIKQILRTAAEEYEPRELGEAFIGSVKGIIFLGTPHKGSRWASFLQRWFGFSTNSKALRDLTANNEVLKSLYQWFRIHNQKWVVKSFYETKRLCGIALIVSEESADPGFLHNVTDLVPLDADHLSICKPKSNLEQQYVTSRKIIKELFAQEANKIDILPLPRVTVGPFRKIAAAVLFIGLLGLSALVLNKYWYSSKIPQEADNQQDWHAQAYSRNDKPVPLLPIKHAPQLRLCPHFFDQENIFTIDALGSCINQVADDIKAGFARSNFPAELYWIFMDSIRRSEVLETTIKPGERFDTAMIRDNGEIRILRNGAWPRDRKGRAFLIPVSFSGAEYDFMIPKACAMIILREVRAIRDVSAPACVMKLNASEIVLGQSIRIDVCSSQNYERGVVVIRDRAGAIVNILEFIPEKCELDYFFDEVGIYLISCRIEGRWGSAEAGYAEVKVLEPPPVPPIPLLVSRHLNGEPFVDIGFMAMRKSSGYILVHAGYQYKFSEAIQLAGRAGIHFNLDGGGSGHPISLDAMMTYHAARFWIGAGVGAWLVKDDSKLDFVSSLGCDLFRLGAGTGSVYFENRLAFRDFFRIKDKAQVSLGLRFSF